MATPEVATAADELVSARPTPRRIRRVAFLTPEFVTERRGDGGVGNYVLKMATALGEQGVEAEVFVKSEHAGIVDLQGLRVERVARSRSWIARAIVRVLVPFMGRRAAVLLHLIDAKRLARALERRHRERPFDIVQSANHELSGWFVRRRPGRVHMIRISTSRLLYDRAYGDGHAAISRFVEALDVRAMRRADRAYAPSSYLASHFNRVHDANVAVVRPPATLAAEPAAELPWPLPPRYLVHFGQLGVRKGTNLLAAALPRAWDEAPDLTMVWAGALSDDELARFRASWGAARSERVVALGVLDRPTLYRVVAGAVASVLPSTVDNLPNTVIESLALRVPVIGSAGASVDELVEDRRTGTLVPLFDDAALAAAMVAAWRDEAPWSGTPMPPSGRLAELEPTEAVRRFLALAGAAIQRDA